MMIDDDNLDLPKLESLALDLARELGKIGLEYFHSSFKPEIKSDKTLVSQADRRLEIRARDILSRLTPHFGFVGEEFGRLKKLSQHPSHTEKDAPQKAMDLNGSLNSELLPSQDALNLNEDLYWMLDPIDGTTNFLARSPLWTTLIALIYKGRPILGIISVPCINEVYIASEGRGARYGALDGNLDSFKPCHVKEKVTLKDAHISCTNANLFAKRNIESWLQPLLHASNEFRTHSDAYGYTRVLCGGIDATFDLICMPYDMPSVQILFDETPGAYFTTIHGHTGPSRYQMGTSLGAASKDLAVEIINHLQNHLIENQESSESHEKDFNFCKEFCLVTDTQQFSIKKTESQKWLRAMETGVAQFLQKHPEHSVEELTVIASEKTARSVKLKDDIVDAPPEDVKTVGIQIKAVVSGGTGLVTSVLPESKSKNSLILTALEEALEQSKEAGCAPGIEILAYRDHVIGHFGGVWGSKFSADDIAESCKIVGALNVKLKEKEIQNIYSRVSFQTEHRLQLFLDGSQQTITQTSSMTSSEVISARGEEKRSVYGHLYYNNHVSPETLQVEYLKKLQDSVTQARELLDADYVPENIDYDYLAVDSDLLGLILHEAVGHAAEGDHIQLNQSGFSEDGRVKNLQIGPDWLDIVIDGTIDNCGLSHVDTEGSPTRRKVLVRNGMLVDAIHTRQTAKVAGSVPDGCARQQSVFHSSMNRMTSIWVHTNKLRPLQPRTELEDLGQPSPLTIRESLDEGGYLDGEKGVLYLSGWKGGTASCSNLEFRAAVVRVYHIRKNQEPVLYREANFTGIATECFRSAIAAFGQIVCRSYGVCGKNGQSVPTSDGGPTVFLMKPNDKVRVIGAGEPS